LQQIKELASTIELVIECRDYRVPLSSRNPLFEDALQGKEKLVVYTKRDLAQEVLDDRVAFSPSKIWPGLLIEKADKNHNPEMASPV